MQILAFGHKSGVGKDTMCSLITKMLRTTYSDRRNILTVGFADHLKSHCYSNFKEYGHLPPNEYEIDRANRKLLLDTLNITAVDLWVKIGNFYRELDPDYWVRKLIMTCSNSKIDLLLIKDLRYPNEAGYVKKVGGKLIKINNPKAEVYDSIADNALNNFKNWDKEIDNSKDMGNLVSQAKQCVEEFLK